MNAERLSQPDSTHRRTGGGIAKVVRRVFGVSELRPGQRAVIDAVLAKEHTLAIMPTGAGKSLCYSVRSA
jgi:superfamily II DNA helicase RecQ